MGSVRMSGVVGRRASRIATADAALASLVVVVLGLMILPLPTWLLDVLIATNLSLSVGVLLAVLYVPEALGIATFPTVLLIATLFRLALNVASTRLILLQADAGEIIRAFGQFVVRGNYVVGAVVFAVITIVQFVVIAKGSERVAEVAARFVLDAMPGKQMAIDAEFRAGSIDGAQAKEKRLQLARESQFYGAMDGAMKFVKGDVIASVVITLVNIVGGLAIGVMQRGMAAETALKRYGLLSIGDGLVTQIPALVLSMAAGILVTRVASEEPDTSLGEELWGQFLSMPKALRVTSLFVFGLALVPGLPAFPFIVIGVVLWLVARARSEQLARMQFEPKRKSKPQRPGATFVPMVTPWSLHVSQDLEGLLDDELRGEQLERPGLMTVCNSVRQQVFADLGVPLPPAQVQVSPQLPPQHAVVSLFEVPARVMWVQPAPSAVQVKVIAEELGRVLRSRASDFMGMGETQTLLHELEQVAPALARQVVPKPVSVPLLSDVLRRLVDEQVSIRDLRAVLEALATAPAANDALALAEHVRASLRRATSYRLTGGRGVLEVYMLDATIEEAIRSSIQHTASGSFLTLAPQACRDVVQAVRTALAGAPPSPGAPHVVLTQPDVRRFVRKLLESELPHVHVVSFAELMPEVALRQLGRATLMGLR